MSFSLRTGLFAAVIALFAVVLSGWSFLLAQQPTATRAGAHPAVGNRGRHERLDLWTRTNPRIPAGSRGPRSASAARG